MTASAAWLENIAEHLDPWLTRGAAETRLKRLDRRLATALRCGPARVHLAAAPYLAVSLAPNLADLATKLAPQSTALAAQLMRDGSSAPPAVACWLAFRHQQIWPTRANPWLHAMGTEKFFWPQAMHALGLAGEPLPPPRLSHLNRTTCQYLEIVLWQDLHSTRVQQWLEWLLRRLEMQGLAAAKDTQGHVYFLMQDALMTIIAAWRATRDLRFLNCLLRLGDAQLRHVSHHDVALCAATITAVIVREAAMAALNESAPA